MNSKFFNVTRRSYSALARFKTHLDEQLSGIRDAGTFKNERVITSKQGAYIKVAGRSDDILNFCANNYLGLSVRIIQIDYIYNYFKLKIWSVYRVIQRSLKLKYKCLRNTAPA